MSMINKFNRSRALARGSYTPEAAAELLILLDEFEQCINYLTLDVVNIEERLGAAMSDMRVANERLEAALEARS